MTITVTLNGQKRTSEVAPDLTLYAYLRREGCFSVKCGCETSNCGLCTVHLDGKPVLSCSVLAVRADGRQVTTLEGLRPQAEELGGYLADEGAEQCGFCSPGFLMNVLAMEQELADPTEKEIQRYLAGNLCRCSGYQGQLRAVAPVSGRPEGGETMSRYVTAPVRKKDAMSLVTGMPVYHRGPGAGWGAAGQAPAQSPRPGPGGGGGYRRRLPCARRGGRLYLEGCPHDPHHQTTAGQTYPEASPYDRLILDRIIRCVGDPVAIVASGDRPGGGEGLRLIRVTYQVQEPLLDFTKAKDNPILVHPEENFRSLCDVGADAKRNLCSVDLFSMGEVEGGTGRLRRGGGADLPHQGQQPGYDGDLPHLCLSGRVQPADVWSAPPRCPSMCAGSWPPPWR